MGTWVSKEDSKFKRVFNLSGKSFSYYDGELLDTYNYEITEEVSSNGKIILEFLKLIDVLDNTDTYEFEINAIDDDILVLEFLDGVRSLQSYTKEK